MESISGMDATFLYTETPTSPMHVGSVAIIEGDLDFETFRERIASRIHLIPKLRKRLVYVPLSIDYPYWVDDPNFDLDMHLQHIALPKPGGWNELRKTASMIFSNHLDHNRPLWSFTFVEGLDNIPQIPKGSVAVISKIHHVAIDGVAGAGILSLLFDPTPTPSKVPPPKPFNPKPLPNELAMMLKSTLSFAQNPLKFPKLISEALTVTFKTGMMSKLRKAEMPTAPFTAPHTPLNGIIAARRKWNTAILSFDRIKALKDIMGTTINDIMLAICAGALRRYLLEKNKLPQKPLVAMVPISTRTKKEEAEKGGNQISSMLIQLATNIEDPIERLETIHENTIRGKTYHGAIGAKTLAQMAESVPFGIANQAARLYSRFHLSELHAPIFNVTITNVPGPQFPLYLNGHKLLHISGMAPIIDGMGLIITIFSYNGSVMVSPTSDVKSMPDLDTFTRYLRESANELEAAVKKVKEAKKRTEKPLKTHPDSDVIFEQIKTFLKKNPDAVKPGSGDFLFHITGDVEGFWRVNLNKTPPVVRRGKFKNPDTTVTIKDEHLMRIAEGTLNVQMAFIQGRLKIEGDMTKAMALGAIFGKLKK
ncbi:MAG: wax ester/triacylglycerol synthase family O-acyltransferase [Bacteroidetes bacterium]|nr:MAG: wax ester/triacylglycerol synthase family O-acyltransferase [Bacteroidota bacterium]